MEVAMIKPPPDFRKDIAPYRIFFTWDITYKCNYRCSYCSYGGAPGAREPVPTRYPSINKWVEVWQDIYEKYGSCEIHFAGGEPFIYPEFMDLIDRLSEMHTLEFSTNLFWNPDDFIERISSGRARIGVSFHPEFVDFGKFFQKALRLKEAGFEVWANYVAYPPIVKEMAEYKHNFEQSGISMSIFPFKGKYNGKEYPEGYTEEERDFLRKLSTYLRTEKTLDFAFIKEEQKPKRRFCRMGQMYAKLYPDGNAYNCCRENAPKLGNLLDGTFSLLEEPFLCEARSCPCS